MGQYAVRYALAHGYEVVELDRKQGLDVLHQGTVSRLMQGCTHVLHLAAYSSMAGFHWNMELNYTANFTGFLNVIEAASTRSVRFAYASSSAVYLDGLGMTFSEDESIDVHKLKSHYGKSKLMNEMVAQSYSFAYGFPAIGLRYFNAYGPGDEKKSNCAPMQHFINANKRGEPIVIYGDGTQAKDFIYVEDAIDITFRLLEEPQATGVYNVGTGVATSFNQLAEMIGGPVKYQPVPTESYQYLTRANMSKLQGVIGNEYPFVSLAEGLKRCL